MTEPKELTGIEGLREALKEPEAWEFDAPHSWSKLSDELEDNIGSKYLAHPCRTWRRTPKPEPVRPLVYQETTVLYSVPRTYQRRKGLSFSITAEQNGPWDGKRSRITVEEIIDPQPAQPEPAAEMTAGEATAWLLADGLRRVVSIGHDSTWRREQGADRVHCCGSEIYRCELPDEAYLPLGLSTRTQVALEKELAEAKTEVERLTKRVIEEQSMSNRRLQKLVETQEDRRCVSVELEQERAKSAQLAEDCHALTNSNHSLSLCLDDATSKSSQLAEDNAILRDAMGHALSELGASRWTLPKIDNAINWINSGLNRTSKQ